MIFGGGNQARLAAGYRKLEQASRQGPDSYRGMLAPARDEHLIGASFAQKPGKAGQLHFGKIVFASPLTHWYRVMVDGLSSELVCSAMTETSSMPFGIRTASPIDTGSYVIVYKSQDVPWGVILGSVPTPSSSALSFSDFIMQGSPAGFRRTAYYSQFRQLFVKDGGQIDFGNSRPADSTCVGEWGRFSPLGGALFMDSFMQFFRIDELCGLSMFYMDRLLRLAAHNYDFISSGREEQMRMDSREFITYSGETPFSWEALGNLTHRDHTLEKTDDIHYNALKAAVEPLHENQRPFYRIETYGGYLGQGGIRQVISPDPDEAKAKRANTTDSPGGIGLFREQISLDGGYALQSAHSIHFAKRLLIPVPKRLRAAEDPQGDDLPASDSAAAGDYTFAGAGLGEEKSKEVIKEHEAPFTPINAVGDLADLLAEVYNWRGLFPFHFHKKDFKLPEEGAEGPFKRLQAPIGLAKLRDSFELDMPVPVELNISHNIADVKYYETTSSISQLRDGSIAFRDGYGSQILMSGGNIYLDPAGDIIMRPGRNVVAWAGHDIVLKAHDSIDLSATRHDVRLKAEHNMELLAGNGGTQGRLLLDCQAADATENVVDKAGEDIQQSGLILSAKQSQLTVFGGNVYVRTGCGSSHSGDIVFDANKGESPVFFITSEVNVHCDYGLNVAMPVNGDKKVVHRLGPNAVQIPTSLTVGLGVIIADRGLQLSGNLVGINCTIGSDGNHTGQFTGQAAGKIGKAEPGGEAYETTSLNIQQQQEAYNSSAVDFSAGSKILDDSYSGEGLMGSAAVINATSFSWRTDTQMGIEGDAGFQMSETHWQQLLRLYGQVETTWTETPVMCQGVKFYPYPGDRTTWDGLYGQQDSLLFDVDAGTDATRDADEYAKDQAEFKSMKLDGNYPVI